MELKNSSDLEVKNDIANENKNHKPLQQADSQKQKTKRTYSEQFIYIRENITMEPCIILYVIPFMISNITSQNLGLEKACLVNLNFSNEICTALRAQDGESQNIYERETQKLLSSALAGKTYMTATIPCLLAIFVGSYSDKTGYRRIFLLMPTIGQILICLNSMVHNFFLYETKLEMFFYIDAIFEALTGGLCVFVVIVFSFISTVSTDDTRTFRMGMVNFAFTLGFPVGMGASGVLLKHTGYYGCYGIALGLHVINFLYIIFGVKDPPRNNKQKQHENRGVDHFFMTFFDLTNIGDTMQVILKKTHNNRRLRLFILLLVVTIIFGPMFGEYTIMYMTTRYRFNWDEVKFSVFQTYNLVTHTVGTMFSVIVLSKYLQWHDSILGIISTISKIAGSFVFCFAPNERIFYVAPLVEILNGTSLLAMRSIASKTVEIDELGKLNSLFGLTENLMPLIYVPLYTSVYTATMEVLPGAVFLMGALMTAPAVMVFLWLLYEHRKQVRKSKAEKCHIINDL